MHSGFTVCLLGNLQILIFEFIFINCVVYGSVYFSLNCFSVAWFIVHELWHWHDLYIYLQFNTNMYTPYTPSSSFSSHLSLFSLPASHSPHQPLSTATPSLGKHHYWLRPSRRSSLLIDIFPASLSSLAAAVPTLPYGTIQIDWLSNAHTGPW